MCKMYVIVDTSKKSKDGTHPVMGSCDFIHSISSLEEAKEDLGYYTECGHSALTTHIYRLVRINEPGEGLTRRRHFTGVIL